MVIHQHYMRDNERFYLVREYLKELSQNSVAKNKGIEAKPSDSANNRRAILMEHLHLFSQELEKEYAGTSTFQNNQETDILNHYKKINVNIHYIHELLTEQVSLDQAVNLSRRGSVAKNEYYHRMAVLLFVQVFIRQLEKEMAQLNP